MFHQRNQKEGETFENFLANIRSLEKTCNFCTKCVDSNLRDRIVLSIRDKDTRSNLLKKRNLTLNDAIDICKTEENADRQNKVYSKEEPCENQSVSAIKSRNKFGRSRNGDIVKECKFCDGKHAMKKELCPAWGKTCKKCLSKNHFASKCRNKKTPRMQNKVSQLQDESDEDPYDSDD